MPSPLDGIIEASVHGDLTTVKALHARDPTLGSAANRSGSTAIHTAHHSGHPDIAKLPLSVSGSLDDFIAAELGWSPSSRDWKRSRRLLASMVWKGSSCVMRSTPAIAAGGLTSGMQVIAARPVP